MTSIIKVDTIQTSAGATPTLASLGLSGGVGQVQSTTLTTTFGASPAGGTFVDISGLSVSITPTSTSSKIYVTCNVTGTTEQGSDFSTSVGIRLMRDSTPIFVGTSGTGNQTNVSSYSAFNVNDARNSTVLTATGLDSPSTTSPVTYKVQCTQGYNMASATRTIQINRVGQSSDAYGTFRSASTITVWEVLA